jgi:hypothetical protein
MWIKTPDDGTICHQILNLVILHNLDFFYHMYNILLIYLYRWDVGRVLVDGFLKDVEELFNFSFVKSDTLKDGYGSAQSVLQVSEIQRVTPGVKTKYLLMNLFTWAYYLARWFHKLRMNLHKNSIYFALLVHRQEYGNLNMFHLAPSPSSLQFITP